MEPIIERATDQVNSIYLPDPELDASQKSGLHFFNTMRRTECIVKNQKGNQQDHLGVIC